jgi:hypothetical protein
MIIHVRYPVNPENTLSMHQGIKNVNFWLKENANQGRLRHLYPGPNNGGNPYRIRLPINSCMECVTEVAEVLERDR